MKIGQAHEWMKQTQQARNFEAGAEPSQIGKVALVTASVGDDASFDEQFKALDTLASSEHFDLIKNALTAFVQLYDRVYDNAQRREVVETRIKAGWRKLPVIVRIELAMKMTESSLAHNDQGKAIALVNETQAMLDGHQWPLEHRVPLSAQIARLRFGAGDKETARTNLDVTLALYNTQRETMINIDRAGALRPVAEVYQAMGDAPATLAAYKAAIEEGVVNPNSRPRAEDLSATCRSMALHGVEPDDALWKRIRDIRQRLGDPW